MKKLISLLVVGVGIGIGASLGWCVWVRLPDAATAFIAGAGCASSSIIIALTISATARIFTLWQQRGKPSSSDVPLVG